jgi:hypothetical protein
MTTHPLGPAHVPITTLLDTLAAPFGITLDITGSMYEASHNPANVVGTTLLLAALFATFVLLSDVRSFADVSDPWGIICDFYGAPKRASAASKRSLMVCHFSLVVYAGCYWMFVVLWGGVLYNITTTTQPELTINPSQVRSD